MSEIPQQPTTDFSKAVEVRYFDDEKEKGKLRDWTADKVEKLVTGFYKIIEKIDIETYEGRQKVISELKRFYNNRFPQWLKDGINQTVSDLEELKDGTIDGIRAANIKKRWRELFRIRLDKMKSAVDIEVSPEDIEAEIGRVMYEVNNWSEQDREQRQNLENNKQI